VGNRPIDRTDRSAERDPNANIAKMVIDGINKGGLLGGVQMIIEDTAQAVAQ
jgi:hypothetical protein